jgi:hypothetical protein
VRRSLTGLLAGVLALVAVLGLPAAPVRGAAPDLTLITSAQYEVLPDEGRVAIGIDITATNHLQDTVTRQYFFDQAYVAVIPGTSAFRITGSTGTPKVTVQSRLATYWLLRIDFGARLAAGKSATFRLTMDLRDPGGAATRSIRVGPTLVSFPVWAYGSPETPGSSVAVTFPPDYQVEFDAGKMAGPRTETDGRRTWTAGGLGDALAFFAYVVADKPGAYAESALTVDVGGSPAVLQVRAWPDDPDWATRVGGLFERGLPVLSSQIGLPWPRTAPLVVQEAVSRTSGGYAGLFDAATGKVEVAYYAGSLVVLHEAAHAWFNGQLLADRWANEAFASWYALSAAAALNEKVTADGLTDALKANAIPLNAWGAVGETPADSENYAYAASLELARRIAERAGDAGLQAVWAAAAAGEAAYQPPNGALERVETPPDWRGLLDLLERAAGATYEDLWHDLVIRPEDVPLLEARTGARIEYAAVVTAAGDWQLPRSVRDAMRTWQFQAATDQLQAARSVLEQRARIGQDSAALQLSPPVTLRTLFEQSGNLEAALREAAAERTAISAVAAAVASRPAQPDVVQTVGLVGATPDVDLEAARTAFAGGRLAESEAAAGRARVAWLSAAEFGRTRITSAILLLLAILIALGIAIGRQRRRRAHRASSLRSPASAASGTARSSGASGPASGDRGGS